MNASEIARKIAEDEQCEGCEHFAWFTFLRHGFRCRHERAPYFCLSGGYGQQIDTYPVTPEWCPLRAALTQPKEPDQPATAPDPS